MNRSMLLALVMAVSALLWILSGALKEKSDVNSESLAVQDESSVFKVKVEHRVAVKMLERVDLQGGIEANREIDIKAETEGSVRNLAIEKGNTVQEGQLLMSLALNDRLARLERAKADLKVSQIDLDSGLRLKNKKLLSENQHQQNLAAVTAAQAQVKEIETEIEHTSIKAAFPGVIDRLYVELGDYVSQGVALAKLVDDSQLKVTVQVPQQHIAKIKVGQTVEAELLDGTRLAGTVSYIASSADTMTRSFTVEALADNQAQVKHFGQSARVSLIIGEQLAHKLSPAMLSLDKNGALQVKTVDKENAVETHTVQLIRSENDGVWLSGLPPEVDLITVGQGFVSEGEVVEVIR